MEVSIYLDETLAQEEPTVSENEQLEIESAIAHHSNMAELADKAGLTRQASSHRQLARVAETKLLPPPPFPELTSAQFAVWKRFLPTAYSGAEGLARYNYDLAPPQVLEIIGEYKDSFTALEIRTAERMKDPALFGIRNFGDKSVTCLLARWGEDRLLSFEDVKRAVIRMLDRSFRHLFAAAAICAALSVVFFSLGGETRMMAVIPLLVVIPTTFTALAIWSRYRDDKAEIAAA